MFIKRRYTNVIVVALLIMGMLPTVASAQCLDPDGLNSFQKGQAEFRLGKSVSVGPDMCSGDGKSVWEYYCPSESSNWSAKQIPCIGGCKDGACVAVPQCLDSDIKNDPSLRGTITFEQGTAKRTLGKDSCTNLGRELTEVSCTTPSGTSLTTIKTPCRTGCIDGRCIPHTERTDGCYFTVKARLVREAKTFNLTDTMVATTVGQYLTRTLPVNLSANANKHEISIQTFTSSGAMLKQYKHTPMFSVALESFKNRTPSGRLKILSAINNDFLIPYDSEVSRIVVSFNGKQIPITLSTAQKSCMRSCITPLEAGMYDRGDVCCVGTGQRLSDTQFVCLLPAPSASPSASPMRGK